MAMTMVEALNATKVLYEDALGESLNYSHPGMVWFKPRTKKKFGGSIFEMKWHSGGNSSIGPNPEDTEVQDPGNQSYEVAKFYPHYITGVFSITEEADDYTDGKEYAVASMIKEEQNRLRKDLELYAARVIYGNGSGLLSSCGVTDNTTTVVVNSVKFIKKGMAIEVRTRSDGTVIASGRTVVSVNKSANTFVISGAAITTATTEGVYVKDARQTASWGTRNEAWGLQAIVATGNPGGGLTENYGRVDRTDAAMEGYQSIYVDRQAATLDLIEDWQRAIDQVEQAGGSTGKGGMIALTSYAVRLAYAKKFTSLRTSEITASAKTFNAAFSGLEYGPLTIIADRHFGTAENPALADFAYIIPKNALWRLEGKKPSWYQMDGRIFRNVSRKRKVEAVFHTSFDIGTDRPNTLCLLDNLNIS
jgi:hypothetical protein